MNDLQNFFSNVITHSEASDKEFQNLMFVLVNEFHWSQSDIEASDLPFVWDLIDARNRMIKEQERQMKKRR